MRKSVSRLVAFLCVFALIICCFAGCSKTTEEEPVMDVTENEVTEVPEVDETPVQDEVEIVDNSWVDLVSEKSKDPDAEPDMNYEGADTVTIGVEYAYIPDTFMFTSNVDATVNELIMQPLLEKDRSGYVIQNGIEGETNKYNNTEYTYNGIATVVVAGNTLKFTLNEDIYFSDGTNLTADDAIFTMYVLADPSYDGMSEFGSLPIIGMEEYRGEMKQKWIAILDDMDTDEKKDSYTEEEAEKFVAAFNEAGIIFTEEIVQGCVDNFAGEYVQDLMNVSEEELKNNNGLQIAFSQFFWDYATGFGEDGLWYDVSGKSYDLIETYPTIEEYWQLILDNHGYDISNNGINYEKIGNRDFADIFISVINEKYPELLEATTDINSADNIAGIVKTGMYSFEVMFTELLPEYLNEFCFYVAPLHYYGNRAEYKYSENRFGFTKGDLSEIRIKTSKVLGAGAYKLDSINENGDILLVRNTLYYKGCPNIKNLIITENIAEADLYYKAYEGEGAYPENSVKAETNTYVIIGIDAKLVSVGGNKLRSESVSLRSAFTTVFEAYRDAAVDQWENQGVESADDSVWGNDLSAVTRNTKMKVIAMLKDAGYVWDDELEKFIEAPEGASLSYKVMLYGYDAAYIVLDHAKSLFNEIGITLVLSKQTTLESLESLIRAGEAQLWVMEIDDFPTAFIFDMLHSEGKNTLFSISSKSFDERIEWAESQFDNDIRAKTYDEIVSEVMELGVMVPIYKRIDAVIYTAAIAPESLTKDMTTYWSWARDVHLLEANITITPVSE